MSEPMSASFAIPENIRSFLEKHNNIVLKITFENSTLINGYGRHLFTAVTLEMQTRTCNRCGYDKIWRPDDTNSKCLRHTYGGYRYDVVFAWTEWRNDVPLEEAFDMWLEKQPQYILEDKGKEIPVVQMTFGEERKCPNEKKNRWEKRLNK